MTARDDRAQSPRLVARQVAELTLARWVRWRRLVPDERLSSVVFEVVLSASIAHHPLRDPEQGCWIGLDDAATHGRDVTATAIAHSMGLSHTTVRRKAADLVAAGLLVRRRQGFLVAEVALGSGLVAQLIEGDTADLIRSLHALAAAGYVPAITVLSTDAATAPPGVIARLVFAFALRTMETFIDLYGDLGTGAIMSSIIAMNIRHITDDVALAIRYSGEQAPPPDALRRPVSIRALARDLNLPFETVRRRVADLLADGRVERKADGVIVPTRTLLSADHLDNNRRIALHFNQMLTTMAGLTTLRGHQPPAGVGPRPAT